MSSYRGSLRDVMSCNVVTQLDSVLQSTTPYYTVLLHIKKYELLGTTKYYSV